MNSVIKILVFNILNLTASIFLNNLYSNILFLGTVFLPLNALFIICIFGISFFRKKLATLNYKYYLAFVCNLLSVIVLYHLWTKYDVPTDTKVLSELILQEFFIANGYYFLLTFIFDKFKATRISAN